jgi:hypothetical protein
MTDDEKNRLEEQISKGLNAEAVLKNPEFIKAMTSIRGELILHFERTTFKQDDERAEIWRKMQVVEWLEGALTRSLTHGEIAKKTLAQRVKEKTAKLLRRV